MLKWPHKVDVHTRIEILKAICNPDWQDFRKSLKGLSTAEKLDRLHEYFTTNFEPDIKTQVDNYINALRRGGLLDAHNEVIR